VTAPIELPSTARPPAPARPVRDAARDLAAGLRIVLVLAVLGALLGFVWSGWSSTGSSAFAQQGGPTWLLDESESAIGADGHFLLITAAVGLVAGLVTWRWTRVRGPITVAALAAAGLVGAQATRLTGYLSGGGSTSGRACALLTSPPIEGSCIGHTKLSVHAPGLYFVEAGVAVLAYALCAAFAVRDNLGRRDPARVSAQRRRAERRGPDPASVEGRADLQDPWRDGDGPGAAQ
jgi:hypothetical protein